jgi:hypothetical protein
VEHFIFTVAFVWWQHLEDSWLDFGALFKRHATTIAATDVSFDAGTALDADAWAHGVGLGAGSIATFALTVFLVVTADGWWHWYGFASWNAASFGWHALALFVLQETGFAEAADDALFGAHWARMGIGAGRGAGGTAWHEHFVFLALRDFRWVGEEHVGLDSCAVPGHHAGAAGVSQESGFAEACGNALFGARAAWCRVGAGAAGVEFFVGRAFWGSRESHWDFVVGITLFFANAFAV